MKPFLLLLTLYVSAYAAPLPPLLPVKRPVPLLSPKHDSAPKNKAMLKMSFRPAGYDLPGLAPVRLTYTKDTIGTFDDIVDTTRVDAIRRVGKGLRFEYTGEAPSVTSRWNLMGEFGPDFYPTTVEDTVTVQWFVPLDQRQPKLFFRVVEYTPTTIAKASLTAVRLNPSLKLQYWRTPRK